MRVWDIPVNRLCNKHLVAQHHEIHCIRSIILNNRRGFANHPEVMRWRNHIGALAIVHAETSNEMEVRGFNHTFGTFTVPKLDSLKMPEPWQPIEQQVQLLRDKGCDCNTEGL